MLKQQHQVFVALLVAVDAMVVILASFLAWLLRLAVLPHWPITRWEDPPKQALVFFTVPITLLAIRWFGLYRPRRDRSLLNEVKQIVKAALMSMVLLVPVLYVMDSSVFRSPFPPQAILGVEVDTGRGQLAALAFILPVCLVLHRVIFRAVLRALRRRGWNLRHVAIIGCGRLGQIVARTLERNSWTGIRVSYFISHQDSSKRVSCLDRPVRGGLNRLEAVMTESKPDAVYVALPIARSAALPDILRRLEKFPVDVRVVPDVNPRYLPESMAVSELDGMPILSYRECPTSGVGGLTKRFVDFVGALAALVLFGPVMLLVGLLVRLSGPGPVIFRQRRVSLAGEVFDIYKFRTMYHVEDEDAPMPTPKAATAAVRVLARLGAARSLSSAGAKSKAAGRAAAVSAGVDHPAAHSQWTRRDDPRITPVGAWLRRTSLDELPQLFNVLRGEMSLVGPRPERPELIEQFREDWRGYMLRQHVKAGMTGWAQVNGHRGQSSLKKRLQYDLFYIRNWSVGFDLKILWMTVFRGFYHRNAH